MGTDLRASSSVAIDAPTSKVWEALTTPELIKRWFFGVDTETDWEVGSPIIHRGEWQGKPYVDKGEIVRFEPPTLLEHTHWSDMSGRPDAPESYQTVTWSVKERDGNSTVLTVAEDNVPSEEALETSEAAWASALKELKDLVES